MLLTLRQECAKLGEKFLPWFASVRIISEVSEAFNEQLRILGIERRELMGFSWNHIRGDYEARVLLQSDGLGMFGKGKTVRSSKPPPSTRDGSAEIRYAKTW